MRAYISVCCGAGAVDSITKLPEVQSLQCMWEVLLLTPIYRHPAGQLLPSQRGEERDQRLPRCVEGQTRWLHPASSGMADTPHRDPVRH